MPRMRQREQALCFGDALLQILVEVGWSRHVPAVEELGPSRSIWFHTSRSLAQQSLDTFVTQVSECSSGPQALPLRQPYLRHGPDPSAPVAHAASPGTGTPATFS